MEFRLKNHLNLAMNQSMTESAHGVESMPDIKPDSMWLVIYECRYDVVRVSPKGDGFFAPGQEPLWRLDCITKWIKEITPPD